ncbi:MAG: ECF-type sigma factor [Thermoanaerobaculia bacterium]|nr:ECF-type sigma factor [Thermoanaerobaculia bacterium]
MSTRVDTDQLAVRIGIDPEAFDQVFERVYSELRSLARAQLRKGPPLFDTTEVIHEAYVRLATGQRLPLTDRRHFLAIASRAMRFVLVDYARKRSARKRGDGTLETQLDEAREAGVEAEIETLLTLDAALAELAEQSPRLVHVVECRYFAGLSEAETAAVLDISLRTVQRDWSLARAKLKRQIGTLGRLS